MAKKSQNEQIMDELNEEISDIEKKSGESLSSDEDDSEVESSDAVISDQQSFTSDDPEEEEAEEADSEEDEAEEVTSEDQDDAESEEEEDQDEDDSDEEESEEQFSKSESAFKQRQKLRQRTAQLQSATTEEERAELLKEIKAIASDLAGKIKDKPQEEQLTEILMAVFDKLPQRSLPQSTLDKIELAATEAARQRELNYVQNEWNTFAGTLQTEYPNASPQQLKAAQRLMDGLSHTIGIGGRQVGKNKVLPYDLDYIYFKQKKQFDDLLFSPRKRTAESRQIGEPEFPERRSRTQSEAIDSPEALKDAEAELGDAAEEVDSAIYVNRGGKRVRVG